MKINVVANIVYKTFLLHYYISMGNKWNKKKLDWKESYYKNRSWKFVESSDYHDLDWYPLGPDQDPGDARLTVITQDPDNPQDYFFSDPMGSWKEIYDLLMSPETFLIRLSFGSKERWIPESKRFSDRQIKKMDKIIVKKNKERKRVNPLGLSPKEKLHVTDPVRIQKRQTSIDPEVAQCLTARQYVSWTGNYVKEVSK
jgi:hypothetical protein